MQSRKSLQRPWCGARVAAGLVLLLTTIAACGGSGGGNVPHGPAPISTLAYIDTTCRDGADGFSMTQELRVRRGEGAPVTIARVPPVGPLQAPVTYCGTLAFARTGIAFLAIGAFQRLGMSPDGTVIVFEVTDDNSILGQSFVPPEQKGIFSVRADGSGLRRLGDASRVPAITRSLAIAEAAFDFSPNGRFVEFTDLGPEHPGGPDAAQEFVLDVETGKRTQVTHIPGTSTDLYGLNSGAFLNDRTIVFDSYSTISGTFTVNIDDGELKAISEVVIPGGGLVPVPVITGFGRLARRVGLPSPPVNPQTNPYTNEVFITDGTNVLELTKFQRGDTELNHPVLGVDGDRVFFTASVNPPLGTNPLEVCQVFSVDALGGDLRQLTSFGASRRSALGCLALRPGDGCRTEFNHAQDVSQDARTGTLVFASSCDPFGTNPNGQQIFVMRPDGSGLRALTDVRGVVRNPDGSVEAELPGSWSYGPYR